MINATPFSLIENVSLKALWLHSSSLFMALKLAVLYRVLFFYDLTLKIDNTILNKSLCPESQNSIYFISFLFSEYLIQSVIPYFHFTSNN